MPAFTARLLGMLHGASRGVTDRQGERLASVYAAKRHDFVRDLIRNDPPETCAFRKPYPSR